MNKKLLEIIYTLNKNELKGFIHFSCNPIFNTNKAAPILLKEMSNYPANYNFNIKDKKEIYFNIQQSNDYKESRFKQIQTQVYQLGLEYIAHLQLAKNKAEQLNATQNYLYEKIPKLYEREAKHLQIRHTIKNEQKYLQSFLNQNIQNKFLIDTIRKKGRKISINSLEPIENLSSFFIIAYLRYACQIINIKNIKNNEDELLFINEIIQKIKSFDIKKHPIIHIYASIYLLLKDPTETQFIRVKELLNLNAHHLEKADAFELYIYAQNYCIRKFNNGDVSYLEELFALYKGTLEKEIIINNGELSPWDYKNIVFVGLKLKAFDWTRNFIEDYKELLPILEQVNAYTYNKARIHFALKEFNLVIHLLNQVEYNDIFYQLDSKSTLLKTYYELEEIDALESLMESFKILILRSSKISKSYQTLYKNLLRYTKRISRTKINDKNRIEKLRKEIGEKACADKAWLLEKLIELEN